MIRFSCPTCQPKPPIWKHWRINYATDLNGFRDRAVQLEALRKEGGPPTQGPEA
jgi:hypothetical protein